MRSTNNFIRALAFGYRIINRFVPWHKLPWRPFPHLSLRLWNLPALRYDLRRDNLHDTSSLPTIPRPTGFTLPSVPTMRGIPVPDSFKVPDPFEPRDLKYRRADGTYNDLGSPRMGSECSRYGRNMPYEKRDPLGEPSPREISNRLMDRDSFKAAESLNLLAAAWIQFMVHDWARHTPDVFDGRNRFKIQLPKEDPWVSSGFGNTMEIERTLPDPTRPKGCPARPPTFLCDGTFWWDGSEIYGSDPQMQQNLRAGTDGKLKMDKDHKDRLPEHPHFPGLDLTGFFGGWWVGLSLLHTLFVRAHNAICNMLKAQHPAWDDDRLFETARLINAALMAKIHTVEWTPAILGQPVLKIGMDANWWGVFGEQISKRLGRVSRSEELSGIPGSELDHHGVPFSLTEEFVSVYRLHPLIPDEYRFHSLTKPDQSLYRTFDDIQGHNTRNAIAMIGSMEDCFYSFGLAHPGAVTLGNYPHFLRQYIPPEHPLPTPRMDVASIDILRDRERGIPPYNRFRQFLRMPRVKSFEELNPKWADKLRELYGRSDVDGSDNVDDVDTMVGLLAEEPPEGFGFSDTAFRIFIVMASRRLKSDRFFTTDYRPEIYTQAGLEWINDNGFESVLLRHYPRLGPAVQGLGNPFHPWRNVHEPAPE